jgi:hypothetical protein
MKERMKDERNNTGLFDKQKKLCVVVKKCFTDCSQQQLSHFFPQLVHALPALLYILYIYVQLLQSTVQS